MSYIKEQRSKGNSKISRRWHNDIKEEINHYNYQFDSAHASGGKCGFCGNNLGYVAKVKGTHLTNNKSKEYEIGFDCLQLVFGRDWNDYWKAKRAIDNLKKEAAKERRRLDYTERFKDILEWFDSLSPEAFEENRFLKDMKQILVTGDRVFTIDMEGGLRRWMNRNKSEYSKEDWERKIKHHKEHTLPLLETLLNKIIKVDHISEGTPSHKIPRSVSDYGFVNDVYQKAKEFNKISKNQLKWMNIIKKKYDNKEETEYITDNTIPF